MTSRVLQALARPPGSTLVLRQGGSTLIELLVQPGGSGPGREQQRPDHVHLHTRFPDDDLDRRVTGAVPPAQSPPSDFVPLHQRSAVQTSPFVAVGPLIPRDSKSADRNGTSTCTTSSIGPGISTCGSAISSSSRLFVSSRSFSEPPTAGAVAIAHQSGVGSWGPRPRHRQYSAVAEAVLREEAAYLAVAEAVAREEAPARESVLLMLEEVETEEELDRAMRLLARVRLGNAAVRGQLTNFKETVTEAVVKACLRAGRDDKALAALSTTNPYGLTCTIPAALSVLRFGAEHKKASVILSSIGRMRRSGLAVSPATADVALRGLIAAQEVPKALDLAQQLQGLGVVLKPATLAALKECSATPGDGSPEQ